MSRWLKHLLDVVGKIRLGLKEKRAIMRATGEPGKVNERITGLPRA